jgi:hypothetical protein
MYIKEVMFLMNTKVLKWVGGGLEAFLAIPLLGAAVILGLAWTPLLLMLIFHIITLVLSVKAGTAKVGPILGIVASCLGIIPFVGWALHVIAAVFLMINAAQEKTGE